MSYTRNLDCKTHHVSKNGTIPILLRVSINGTHDYFNTGRRIKEAYYDKEKKIVKSGVKGAGGFNTLIDKHKTKIDEIISEFDRKGEIATIAKVKELYAKKVGKEKSKCFYDFVSEKIKWEREYTDITAGSLNNYDFQLKKLKLYRKKLSIHDIDENFITKYKHYLTKTLGQKDNTIYHALCFLRKYTKMLFDNGKINPYPFANFEVGSPFESELVYLAPEELIRLHDLYESKELTKISKKAKSKYARDFNVGEKYQEVLRYFLVACYTGLRHSDIKTLERKHIVDLSIVKELQKGRLKKKKTVRIPIRKRLLSLLNLHSPSKLIFENPVMEDSQTNKYLKEIMTIAKIEKHITFHKARYTFGIISLLAGMQLEVVSCILGHSELRTTQRYAKVINSLTEREMNKWDNFLKEVIGLSDCIQLFCANCNFSLLKVDRNVIRQNKIQCFCQNCNAEDWYNLQPVFESANR